MFWLFENNCTKLNFIQIFDNFKKYEDNQTNCVNFVYDFTEKEINIDIPTEKPISICYTIKIKDNYIQYINKNTIITFKIESKFITENNENNFLKVPYFQWKYIKVNNEKLPNISIDNYDFYYPNINFQIWKINNNKLFILEINNNITKKYILEKNHL